MVHNGKENPKLLPLIEKTELQLETCPFCGSDAQIENTHTPHYWVECMNCEAEVGDDHRGRKYGSIRAHINSIQRAAEIWNRRTK